MDYVKAFTKGLFSSPGNNLMPYPYSSDMRNLRIDNGVMTVRKGYRNIVRSNLYTEMSGIASNNGNLYAVVNQNVTSVDLTLGTYTTIGALESKNHVYPLTFNKYTMFLSDSVPYVYDGTSLIPISTVASGVVKTATFTGTGLNNLTSGGVANGVAQHTYDIEITGTGTPDTFKWRIDGGTYTTGVTITGSAQTLSVYGTTITFATTTGHTIGDKWQVITTARDTPRFGVSFLNFTWVAGGGTGINSQRNILYRSPAIVLTSDIVKCYDFIGTGTFQMPRKSDILALKTTLSRLFIFEEDRLEWIDKNSYTTISGVVTFFSNPLAQGEAVPNNGSVIVAGDKLFFLTKGKRIKSINYVVGVDQVEIADISNTPDVGITKFLDEQLNDDLSATVGFYDETLKHCKWFVRSRNSTVNDIVIIYDLVNSTFLVDNNKFYSCITRHSDGNYYAGGSLNTDLYQDEYGQDDDGGEISWYRYTAPLDNEKPWQNKLISEVSTTGTIDSTTVIKKEVFVDNDSVDTSYISKPSPVLNVGIGSSPIWVRPIWEQPQPESIVRFTKRRGAEYINSIWKFLQIKYSGSWVGQNFTLETIHTKEKVTEYREFDDV